MTETERFFAKVDASGVCWEWTGSLRNGYGQFYVGPRGNPKKMPYAHRWAWEHLVGPIPEGMQIDHLCRNPRCVDPDHLQVVTQRENLARGYGRSGGRTHCYKGHLLSGPNARIARGRRECRTCDRERKRSAA